MLRRGPGIEGSFPLALRSPIQGVLLGQVHGYAGLALQRVVAGYARQGLELLITIMVMVMIVPVLLIAPAMLVFIPPLVILVPATFAGFV